MLNMKYELVNLAEIKPEVAPPSELQQESLELQGQLQPVRLECINPQKNDGYKYRVVDGRRRLTDMLKRGMSQGQALVYPEGELTPETFHLQALTLNSGKANYMDEADHIAVLTDQHGYTVEDVSTATNHSISTVLNRLDLHKKLLPAFQEDLRSGVIKVSSAYELVKISKPEQQIIYDTGVKGVKKITTLVKEIRNSKNIPVEVDLPSSDELPTSVDEQLVNPIGPGLFVPYEQIMELISSGQGVISYQGIAYLMTIVEADNEN